MNDALNLFKALGDGTRLKIINLLSEKECYVDMLSEQLGLTQATVSFHIKKLLTAGILKARREQYYTMYSLDKEKLDARVIDLLIEPKRDDDANKKSEEAFREKVLKTFMPCGYCVSLPSHSKKRKVIFEEIIKLFEPGKSYKESEVNDIIYQIHADYCMIRRSFIEFGWMTRENGVYTVTYQKNSL